ASRCRPIFRSGTSTVTATLTFCTLSLPDALPIFPHGDGVPVVVEGHDIRLLQQLIAVVVGRDELHPRSADVQVHRVEPQQPVPRSEEHTSELQSRFDLVCRLLLEKKKTNKTIRTQ